MRSKKVFINIVALACTLVSNLGYAYDGESIKAIFVRYNGQYEYLTEEQKEVLDNLIACIDRLNQKKKEIFEKRRRSSRIGKLLDKIVLQDAFEKCKWKLISPFSDEEVQDIVDTCTSYKTTPHKPLDLPCEN